MDKAQTSEFLPSQNESGIDLNEIVSTIKRQWRIVALCGILMLFLGAAFAFTATPKYTASSTLFIDGDNKQIADQLLSDGNRNSGYPTRDDDATVLSEVEILRSERVATLVVERLDLMNDPEFQKRTPSLVSRVVTTLKSLVASDTSPKAENVEALKQSVKEALMRNTSASRVGRTYILEVDYVSRSPETAAKIANAIVDAYLEDQYNSKFDATRRASDWLQTRIEALRQKSLDSDLLVQKFRAEKGLIATGGELVSEQQLTQINTNLVKAQSAAADAKSKYDSVQAVVASGDIRSAVVGSLESPVINKLQQEALDVSRREAEISKRFGRDHYQAVLLRAKLQEYDEVMFKELRRIAGTYRQEYEVASASQKALEGQVAAATSTSAVANDDLVQLREYERAAETYKTLYETYLQRFQEASQRESFPVTAARVVTRAEPPQDASYPKKPLILALALVMGCGVGAAIGAYREFGERFFRTGEQVQKELSMEFIGQIPLEKHEAGGSKLDASRVGPRGVLSKSNLDRYIIDHPLSSFAETIRSAKIAADFKAGPKSGRVIGIVSVLPREGKSTVAVNFAQHLAKQGSRTLLIDADLRNPGATRAIGANARSGLYEVLSESQAVEDVLLTDVETGLVFLPTIIKQRILFSAELLSSDAMNDLLASFSKAFDYIVLDLPPLGPVVDARAISSKIDSFLMIIEWGATARRIVRTAVQTHPGIMRKCAGVILNKVDLSKVKLYLHQDENFYHNSRYGDYYLETK
ncbi:succinoglycan biosynthesis transport protein ExoP [Rhizobium sp. PP-CC-3A-592]|nr:succinoglycan biosynthesis transport protein ExoP [Rhizobium sp. PP-CC-3A-592]